MELSPEQQEAIRVFTEGRNMFLTGPGGTGKTALIKKMVELCKTNGKKIQVCALTGCAAVLLNCQAKTVHSWAGIGLANGDVDFIVKRVASNKYKATHWKKIDVLIIDEVSMMSQKIFEILNSIGQKVRKSTLPFGGLQVIFSGDFYQLPPVDDKQNEDPAASAFCFESPDWSKTFPNVVQLKKIFRQTDQAYTAILNQIRVGKLYKSALETLTPHIGKTLPATFVPTILLPRRREAEQINALELAKLPSEKKVYTLARADILPEKAQPQHNNTISAEQREMEYTFLVNNIMADKEVVLKKGAQVMCIANIDMESAEPIVNGSQGIIIDFVNNLPLVQFNNGARRTVGYHTWSSETYPSIGVKQIPLIYAWAITIHKAQGVSLDMAQIDAGSNIFECGQTYVALSRIKSLDGLYLTAFNPQKIKVNKKVQEFYATLPQAANATLPQAANATLPQAANATLPQAANATSPPTAL
jgi:ATP-dependent DNA helicase PIF1